MRLTFAAAQIPIGILLDRYGPRRVQSVVLVAAAAGAALFAVSDNFLLPLAGRPLIGLGVAASLTSGLKALVLWFPKDRIPLLNGLMIMLGALGAVTATSPAELLLVSVGWRGLFELLTARPSCRSRRAVLQVSRHPYHLVVDRIELARLLGALLAALERAGHNVQLACSVGAVSCR